MIIRNQFPTHRGSALEHEAAILDPDASTLDVPDRNYASAASLPTRNHFELNFQPCRRRHLGDKHSRSAHYSRGDHQGDYRAISPLIV